MAKGSMPALALLLGKASAKSSKEDDERDEYDGEDKAEYFREFKSALDDDDDEAAMEALSGFVRCCGEG